MLLFFTGNRLQNAQLVVSCRFRVSLKQKIQDNFADVHGIAIYRKVLCKQYACTEIILKFSNILWLLILRALVITRTIQVRIMCIWFY